MILRNGRIIGRDRILEGHALVAEGERIQAIVAQSATQADSAEEVVDLEGRYLSPGFLDIHFHGLCQHETSDPDALPEILRLLPGYGVTACLPTLATVPAEQYFRWLEKVEELAGSNPPGAMLLGGHLEGPYINRQCRGGMREDLIWDPNPAQYRKLVERHAGAIKMMTVSPELPGALELISFLAEQGIIVSGGHSVASYEEMRAGIEAGIKNICHLYDNTPLEFLQNENKLRRPSIDETALISDEVCVEVIPDGIHVDPVFLKLIRQCKGPDQVILITDAVPGAGSRDGVYCLPDGRRFITQADDVARLMETGQICGSSLTMNRALKKYMIHSGADLVEAVRAASLNPATLLGYSQVMGSLEPGKLANLVVLDDDLQVSQTYIKGKLAYAA